MRRYNLYLSLKSRFLYNLDLIILAMEVLDPEFADHLSLSLKIVNPSLTTEKGLYPVLYILRTSNPIRLLYKSGLIPIEDAFTVAETLFRILLSQYWSKLFNALFLSYIDQSDLKRSFAKRFLRKYHFYYMSKMHAYKVGQVSYKETVTINSIAMAYVYLLHLVSKQKDLFFFIEALYTFSPSQITLDKKF
nr:hypothetical protein [Porphyrostromium boryanum]